MRAGKRRRNAQPVGGAGAPFDDTLALFAPGAFNGSHSAGPARVVFNLRTNSLDRVLSRFAPALYGSEHGCTAAGYDHCMKSTHATVDVAWLVAQMRENEDTLAMVRDEVLDTAKRVGAPLLAVRYEDLLRDADAVFQAYVLPFLGLDAAPLRPVQGHVQAKPSEGHVKRTGNLTHADMIDNWADVAAAAAAAGLEDALVDEAFRDATGEVLVVNPPPGYKARGR